MLRGRYGWLSQRNQFILPTFLTRTTPPHPSSPVEGKKRLGRRIRAHREREREREKREGAKRKRDTERNIGRKRGWSAIARRLIWFNGEFIWVDAPPFNQQDCLRPPTGVGPRVPLKIIPVKTCLSPFRERERERERGEVCFRHFLSRNRSILVFGEGRDGDGLRLVVGQLSKPRRRLLPVANPWRTSFSLSVSLSLSLFQRCGLRESIVIFIF